MSMMLNRKFHEVICSLKVRVSFPSCTTTFIIVQLQEASASNHEPFSHYQKSFSACMEKEKQFDNVYKCVTSSVFSVYIQLHNIRHVLISFWECDTRTQEHKAALKCHKSK